MQRLGILGGTFDPPHNAHMILAQYAYEQLNLDKVLFVPAGIPPHKPTTRTSVDERIAMLRCVLDEHDYFELSRVEIDRPGPHYTIDTVRIIQDQNPGTDLFFIMGGDVYRDLPTWDRPQEMFATCKLVVAVMRRPGFGNPDLALDMHEDQIPGLKDNAMMLNSPLVEISSTELVERLGQGKTIQYMVPDKILDFIQRYHLYEEPTS